MTGGVVFDLETLVAVDWPDGAGTDRLRPPAAAVAAALRERGVAVPPELERAYRDGGVDAPPGAAVPLPAAVDAALRSLGVDPPASAVRRAVVAAADPRVATREGAVESVAAAADGGAVGLFVDAAVPELVGRVLARSDLDRDEFDAVRSGAATGWRATDPRAFEAVAAALSVDAGDLVVVVDREARATAAREAGASAVVAGTEPLPAVVASIEGRERGGSPPRGDSI